jgi:hypothetical protein
MGVFRKLNTSSFKTVPPKAPSKPLAIQSEPQGMRKELKILKPVKTSYGIDVTICASTPPHPLDKVGKKWVTVVTKEHTAESFVATYHEKQIVVPSHVQPQAKASLTQMAKDLNGGIKNAVAVKDLSLGGAVGKRVRYYQAPTLSDKVHEAMQKGKPFHHLNTYDNRQVTEFDGYKGNVRTWMESRDSKGQVTRVHPKNIRGQKDTCLNIPHYPATEKEVKAVLQSQGMSEENIAVLLKSKPQTEEEFYKIFKSLFPPLD